MPVSVSASNRISLDASLWAGIQRTLRVPDDGGIYPLPPALGRLPVRAAADYPERVPEAWRDGTHVLVPMHAQEAAWLQFQARPGDLRAIKIGVGDIDALTGSSWSDTLEASPQNYIVCPYQPWVDGFKVGPARVRQFVAVPLHAGLTVEQQLTGREGSGIRIACFAPKPGALAAGVPPRPRTRRTRELGVGAGGRIEQRIYPDPLGVTAWAPVATTVVSLHLVEAREYAAITGEAAPPSPIDARTYSRFGLPWFVVYDADRGDVAATERLSSVRSVDELSGTREESSVPEAPIRPKVRPIPPRSRRSS
jgi:hypothetical protein